jgi:hypothetical protein
MKTMGNKESEDRAGGVDEASVREVRMCKGIDVGSVSVDTVVPGKSSKVLKTGYTASGDQRYDMGEARTPS